jgi:polar amino acid transport system substrate-binding protein
MIMFNRRHLLSSCMLNSAMLISAMLMGCATQAPSSVPAPEAVKALAPTGVLRIGVYAGSPTSLVNKDGQKLGVAYELGMLVAKEMGVPAKVIEYQRIAQILDGMKAGEVDITFTNASAARRAEFDFTPAALKQDLTLLVRSGAGLSKVQDMDALLDGKPQRMGVTQGSSSEGIMAARLKQTKLDSSPNLTVAAQKMRDAQIDTFATNRGNLQELQALVPGSRILADAWGQEQFAVGIPKNRAAALKPLESIMSQAIKSGAFEGMIRRSGLLGAEVIQP